MSNINSVTNRRREKYHTIKLFGFHKYGGIVSGPQIEERVKKNLALLREEHGKGGDAPALFMKHPHLRSFWT